MDPHSTFEVRMVHGGHTRGEGMELLVHIRGLRTTSERRTRLWGLYKQDLKLH